MESFRNRFIATSSPWSKENSKDITSEIGNTTILV